MFSGSAHLVVMHRDDLSWVSSNESHLNTKLYPVTGRMYKKQVSLGREVVTEFLMQTFVVFIERQERLCLRLGLVWGAGCS
ncbi:hypothetical protein EVAR_54608_1 [Eumeta japonica]|uniref:Uncharacterized protein n=1 Tax=Eumeta variegata TaxID=151549 RepID=A0A4C1YNM2_EUMVA|nr:hypothetical protein EVAR_54608_1 [Eumeta japonica]